MYRISSGQYGSAGVQLANNACLGYGDGLLLHGLKKDGSAVLVHLVELVNAANAQIAEHQSS